MNLLAKDSPVYLKRLVKALNEYSGTGNGNGFVASVSTCRVRCNLARMRHGVVEVHSFSTKPEWFVPSDHQFENTYGQSIVACTRARL